jgi:hypothetical protein
MANNQFNLTDFTDSDGNVMEDLYPGLHPLYYTTRDNGELCPSCVNKERARIDAAIKEPGTDKQWEVVGVESNDHDQDLDCTHCEERIPPHYDERISAEAEQRFAAEDAESVSV